MTPRAKPARPANKNVETVKRHAVTTLAVDIGGTGIKATVLDEEGVMLVDRLRVKTPYPAPPEVIIETLAALAGRLPAYDRISVGFPGVVRDRRVVTAPNFGNEIWHRFPLADALEEKLGKPVRILNDAEVQGYGVICGNGIEFVVTLGTGLGSALFHNGRVTPHMEFSHFPVWGKKTFDAYVGEAAREALTEKKWNNRVAKSIEAFRVLFNFDRMYIGGGNAMKLKIDLPPDVRIVSNDAGLTGGIRLWDAQTNNED